jgi:probable phosphoglycerate mutase
MRAMSATTWLFGLRHGESRANAAGEVAWDPARAALDLGLTAAGREAVARSVAAAGLPPGVVLVVSSDLRRARESAEVACGVLGPGARLAFDPRLRERRFGAAEGGSNLLYGPAWAQDARDPGARPWGAESAADVGARALALVHELVATRAGAPVLLVSHGDPLQILRAVLAGQGPGAHRQGPHLAPAELLPLPAPT